MKVGDLVRMRAQSYHKIYGHGIIVRNVSTEKQLVQVYWSTYGLGNRIAHHSLEKVNESR